MFDPALTAAGALVGFLVGLTGMGGGALLTPLLVLVLGVPPLAAVSSDLVTSLVMKPFAGAVHLRRGSVDTRLLRWLVAGSVPAALASSVALGLLAHRVDVDAAQHVLKRVIAVALLLSVAATVARLVLDTRRGARTGAGPSADTAPVAVRRAATLAIGAVGGLAVGLTSVGAGTLVVSLLMLAYPRLRAREVVGTDVVQAIPLVGAATVGHLLFGDVRMSLTVPLLLGAVPAAVLGARASASAPDAVVRPVVALVLTASGGALLGASTPVLLGAALAAAVLVVVVGTPRLRPRTGLARPVPMAREAEPDLG